MVNLSPITSCLWRIIEGHHGRVAAYPMRAIEFPVGLAFLLAKKAIRKACLQTPLLLARLPSLSHCSSGPRAIGKARWPLWGYLQLGFHHILIGLELKWSSLASVTV